MTAGVSDFAATGIVTTLGGPILVAVCVANFFRRNKINWYFLAPFIQAYIVVGAYIALFGLHKTTSLLGNLAFVWCGCTLAAVAVCMVIHWNTSYVIRRAVPLDLENVLLRLIGPYLFFGIPALALSAPTGPIENCAYRCKGLSLTWGYMDFAGSFIFPAMVLCGLTTVFYALLVVAVRKEDQDE